MITTARTMAAGRMGVPKARPLRECARLPVSIDLVPHLILERLPVSLVSTRSYLVRGWKRWPENRIVPCVPQNKIYQDSVLPASRSVPSRSLMNLYRYISFDRKVGFRRKNGGYPARDCTQKSC